MALLFSAICFEGWGRKVLTFIPSAVFYFAKDFVLLAGAVIFGVKPQVTRAALQLYSPFTGFLVGAVLWTGVEIFNPDQVGIAFGLVGLRAYWLWWLVAPLAIVNALKDAGDRRRTVLILSGVALVVCAMAVVQFLSPASASVNSYASYNGKAVAEVAAVGATGRARVASTFSYIAGFTDFTILAPSLLIAVGLNEQHRTTRLLAMWSALLSLGATMMSGSRTPVVLGLGALLCQLWGVGFVNSQLGRRFILGIAASSALFFFVFPDAIQGVVHRFNGGDTEARLGEVWNLLPPVALTSNDYPLMGIGTGTQQNAVVALGLNSEWDSEGEPGRYLIELGPIGYILVWSARLGLVSMLVRCARRLHKAGQGPAAGLAASLGFVESFGNLTFDHVFQALFFVGVGFVLHWTISIGPEGKPRPKLGGRPRQSPIASARPIFP